MIGLSLPLRARKGVRPAGRREARGLVEVSWIGQKRISWKNKI
jgi:hypothetical protein